MGATRRVLVATSDVVGPVMAGPGIRAWEFARVLAQHFPTTLVAPAPVPGDAPGFTVVGVPEGEAGVQAMAALIAAADIIIAQTLPPALIADLRPDQYLIGDLYCPWLLENLEHHRADPSEDDDWIAHDIENLGRLLVRGDFFICAGDRQRSYWLGALAFMGRLTEEMYARDPQGRGLIDIVPFGTASAPPATHPPVLKGIVPGIGRDDFVALWGGGLWNWLDPLTLIRATARLRDAGYPIRTFFLGTQRPTSGTGDPLRPSMVEATRQLSASLGLTGTHVFFTDRWTPYAERIAYLQEADVGISLHQATLETQFAFRTRVLDYLWAGLVPVVNDGDTIADLLRAHDAGKIVPIGDDAALAEAIGALIDAPDERARLATRCAALADAYTWEKVTEPLIAFCRDPHTYAHADAILARVSAEMAQLRRTTHETSLYAERLEREIAARDAHIQYADKYLTAINDRPVRHAARAMLTKVRSRVRRDPAEV